MSMTFSDRVSREGAVYGGFVDAIGGVATIVLAIVGLAGARPEMMVAIATIVFGGALLIQGGAMASEFAHIMFPAGARGMPLEDFSGSSLSALFLAGAAGIVLGILALLGIVSTILKSVSIIAFGCALVLSSNSVWRLHALKRASTTVEGSTTLEGQEISGATFLANEIASGSSGVQWLAGLAAIVLGVLAVAGVNSIVLTLSALIVLGATLVLTGSSLSATVVSLMRPMSHA